MFKVLVNGRQSEFFCKGEYEAGDTVELRIPLMTDVSTRVTSDDVDLGRSEVVGGSLFYRFVMPEHDVDVSFTHYGGMMRDPTVKPAMGMMGMGMSMGISMSSVNGKMNDVTADERENDNSVPKFCPECGAKTNGGKFCAECGYKLV